ncbi:BQ2448_3069 [Microbotryum intermedium]|uniref:BQ2448_3069 protein n=1 Tax=Microbotryum intermedium TaxID=269621 RepID=A0A238FH80_9BASI|nr:BQ2448_3069 [Microbotryum intermedium]
MVGCSLAWRGRVSLRLNNSPRVPSFAGPIALAAGLLSVICFSEPFWQNFYILRCDTLNVTMKAGAWGVCTKLRNSTGIIGPDGWCTSKTSGYTLNFVTNSSGVNNWPTFLQNPNVSTVTPIDDNVLFGTAGNGGVTVLTSGQTRLLWLQVVAAISTVATVASLACPPSYLGSPQSRLFAFQKSGILPIVLALTAFILAFITFCVTLSISMSARNRLNAIGGGVNAGLGNTVWFTMASSIVMLPAICSVLMRSSPNEYQDL